MEVEGMYFGVKRWWLRLRGRRWRGVVRDYRGGG